MAAAARAATTSLFVPWHRLLPLLRTTRPFSAAASPPPSSSSPNPTKTKKRKKKNLIEVANFLPNWGIGYHMAKTHWTNVSYQITKINLYKDGRHGKAWGVAFKDGVPADAPKKISGVHKRCWRYLPRPPKAVEAQPKAESQAA
ncbi:hypothetical protein Droror1_Dr00019132 [Drosera rotundifolia]